MGTRDDMCGIDVARMAELGGFAEEITIIGCVYKQDGDVLYRVTDDLDEAYHFYESAARQGIRQPLLAMLRCACCHSGRKQRRQYFGTLPERSGRALRAGAARSFQRLS